MKTWDELWRGEPWVPFACEAIGRAGPTTNASLKEVKAYVADVDSGGTEKVYYNADDLRNIAAGLSAVASWLEERSKNSVK